MGIFTDFINALVHLSVMIATLIVLYIFVIMFYDAMKSLKTGIHDRRHDRFTYVFYALISVFLIIGITIASYRTLDLSQFIAVMVLIVLIILVRFNPKFFK